MIKQLLIPLIMLCVGAGTAYGQAGVNTDLMGRITISAGSFSDGELNGNLAIVYQLDSNSIYTSIQEAQPQPTEHFSLFPNPSREEITIQNNEKVINSFNLRIFDMSGRLISEKLNNSDFMATVPVTGLPEGTYFAGIYSADNQLVKVISFIKQ